MISVSSTKILDIIRTSILKILQRMEGNGGDYPFIDTKFDIVSGRDFGEDDAPFKQRGCIYSWIQGRGLESLAKHAAFFSERGDENLSRRLDVQLSKATLSLEAIRKRHAGRLPFAMNPQGESFFPAVASPGNFSDLFYAKGLYAAGHRLGRNEFCDEGKRLFSQVLQAIRENRFITDQQSFDPKNAVQFIPGKFPQGPRMIALGGLADFIQWDKESSAYEDLAEEFIRFILDYHVQTHDNQNHLQEYDFVESITEDRSIWKDGQVIFSDPGHALEFVGLASRCLCVMNPGRHDALFRRCREILPRLFCHVFDYGFNPAGGGICKGYDLVSRSSINSDMPWWNLPETVRAGVLLQRLFPESPASEIDRRIRQAFESFCSGFLQPNGFGCQTRSAEGKIIPVIPAVPDADPGYHTNLSLIQAL